MCQWHTHCLIGMMMRMRQSRLNCQWGTFFQHDLQSTVKNADEAGEVMKAITTIMTMKKWEPLVILARPPEHHDDTEETGEEKMPEGFVHPQVFPLGQAIYHLCCSKYCKYVITIHSFSLNLTSVSDALQLQYLPTLWYLMLQSIKTMLATTANASVLVKCLNITEYIIEISLKSHWIQ